MSTTPLSGRRVRVASSLDRRHLPLSQVSPLVRVRRNAEPSTLASVDTVSAAWASIRVWHVWLNLIGFVSLVIATTLLHFFRTVSVRARGAGHAVWTGDCRASRCDPRRGRSDKPGHLLSQGVAHSSAPDNRARLAGSGSSPIFGSGNRADRCWFPCDPWRWLSTPWRLVSERGALNHPDAIEHATVQGGTSSNTCKRHRNPQLRRRSCSVL